MVISLLNAQKGRHTRQIFAQVPEKKPVVYYKW